MMRTSKGEENFLMFVKGNCYLYSRKENAFSDLNLRTRTQNLLYFDPKTCTQYVSRKGKIAKRCINQKKKILIPNQNSLTGSISLAFDARRQWFVYVALLKKRGPILRLLSEDGTVSKRLTTLKSKWISHSLDTGSGLVYYKVDLDERIYKLNYTNSRRVAKVLVVTKLLELFTLAVEPRQGRIAWCIHPPATAVLKGASCLAVFDMKTKSKKCVLFPKHRGTGRLITDIFWHGEELWVFFEKLCLVFRYTDSGGWKKKQGVIQLTLPEILTDRIIFHG